MNRELVVLLTIAIGAGSAWAAHAIGLSPALGAFIAGMLLAESPFATQIRSDIVTVTILSMFVAPYMAAYAASLSERLRALLLKGPPQTPEASTHPGLSLCARTFIIGFGPAGQRVATNCWRTV